MKIDFQGISAINVAENILAVPQIGYENPYEELGEGIILIEKGISVQSMQ
jgi:hypothetical protein